MNDLTLPVLVGLIIGIVQVSKGFIPQRFVPLYTLCIGVGCALLFQGVEKANIVTGLIAGLSAMGVWSGAKASVQSPLVE